MVDGGKGQLGVAVRVLENLGLADQIPVCALAKQFEEVYLPGEADPIRLPRQSEALYLLQRLRDESHRFAITYQRQLRGNRMTKSWLDEIPGLGPTRKKRLIKELGGVKAVRLASLEGLKALTWLPDAVAEAVHAKAQGTAGPPSRRPQLTPLPSFARQPAEDADASTDGDREVAVGLPRS
jgi:excinuclease ABC subunit C